MEEEFELLESQNSFDIKALLFRALNYWYLFVISIAIAVGVAYFINKRLERLYSVKSLISIKEEQNPFFTANTSLVFNWGGTSDKIETVKIILQSRTHNEEIVRLLQTYIHYMKKGPYRYEDIHTSAPFEITLDETKQQLLNHTIGVELVGENSYELSVLPNDEESFQTINYLTNKTRTQNSALNELKQTYTFQDTVRNPLFNFSLKKVKDAQWNIGEKFYLKFTSLNSEINKYRGIAIDLKTRGASMLVLSLKGTNRAIMADYLNATAEVLKARQLDQKNQFAVNTITFIDQAIRSVKDSLKVDEQRLKDFKLDNKVFNPTSESSEIFSKLNNYDEQKSAVNLKIQYVNLLENYLTNNNDYSILPAPASSGIDDRNITENVAKIVSLSVERAQRSENVKSDLFLQKIDRDIEASKNVLLENLRSVKSSIDLDMRSLNSQIARANSEFRKLPEEEQQLFNIQRSYRISDESYTMLLTKKNEAGIAKASNVSDIRIIDEAKDLGQSAIAPNTKKNYSVALFVGLLFPLAFVFITTLLDNNVNSPEDIKKLSKIPILGVVNRSRIKTNLAVFESPKSSVAESFRSIRSGLQYIYKNLNKNNTKTILITSSVSGEGKTFCSINIASVFSLTGKKTVLVGLDLRKPKIFGDFEISNDFGVVNYLIGQKTLDEVVQSTQHDNLDIITSGPIPPNPSELLISEQMEEFIEELKTRYDYVVLDTPPFGLVADALDLTTFADATIYIVRQDYSKKAMLNMINDKYQKREVKNISFVFNDYRQKAKYGYGYGYGYGYAYGSYGNGYHEDERKTLMTRFKNLFKKT